MNTREYVSWKILKSDENCPLATYLRNVSADDSNTRLITLVVDDTAMNEDNAIDNHLCSS